jgi:hypothetical protein
MPDDDENDDDDDNNDLYFKWVREIQQHNEVGLAHYDEYDGVYYIVRMVLPDHDGL